MTYEEMKQWVDSATYEMLLVRWRDLPFDDPFFFQLGEYYLQKIVDKRSEVGEEEHKKVLSRLSWKGKQDEDTTGLRVKQ